MMTWVLPLTLTSSCSLGPSGTIAAFEMIWLGPYVMIAVGGVACPVGHARRNEPAGIPAAATTVKFTEIASAPAGIPQMPVTSRVRWPPLGKIPPVIGAPPRVSATRQG